MNWLSVYIFHNIAFDTLLIEHIEPLIKKLKSKNYSHNAFFIRYWEGGPHIRLRVDVTDTATLETLKSIITNETIAYFDKKEDPTYSIQFQEYVQELERYGGKKAITIAEHIFVKSSQITLDLLKKNKENWDYSMAISNAMKMHVILIKSVFKTLDASIHFYKTFYINWLQHSIKIREDNTIDPLEIKKTLSYFEQSYTKQKTVIQQLVNNLWEETNHEDWLQDWSLFCAQLDIDITTLAAENAIVFPENISLEAFASVPKKDIPKYVLLDSYIHMTNNRLGIYLRDESFIAFLLLKGFEDFRSLSEETE